MGSEPDVVGSAATATGDDIVAAGLFTLTGRSGATDSTVIRQRRGRGLRISRSGGIGAPRPPTPRRAGNTSSSPSARSGSTCSRRRRRTPRPLAHLRPATRGDDHPRPPERPHGDPRGHLERRPLRARGRTLAPGPRHGDDAGPVGRRRDRQLTDRQTSTVTSQRTPGSSLTSSRSRRSRSRRTSGSGSPASRIHRAPVDTSDSGPAVDVTYRKSAVRSSAVTSQTTYPRRRGST